MCNSNLLKINKTLNSLDILNKQPPNIKASKNRKINNNAIRFLDANYNFSVPFDYSDKNILDFKKPVKKVVKKAVKKSVKKPVKKPVKKVVKKAVINN